MNLRGWYDNNEELIIVFGSINWLVNLILLFSKIIR